MPGFDSPAGPQAPSAFKAQFRTTCAQYLVGDEREWRVLRLNPATAPPVSKVIATRWRADNERLQESGAETPADYHVVKIALRTMHIRFSVSGRTVQDGVITPGTLHVTEPAASVHCCFLGPYDVLHLFVPNTLIAECACDMPGHQAAVLCPDAVPSKDMMIDSLGRALLDADRIGGSFGQLYADCISIAIVARLLAPPSRVGASRRPTSGKLAPWRLKRAIEYVEARLDETVSLAGVAASAGLTRMHFAAQFRAATGLRPHEYVLRRRVERAQEMLCRTRMSLVDVALAVGFQTQSHFTTVFKRYSGQPPRAWREARGVQQI